MKPFLALLALSLLAFQIPRAQQTILAAPTATGTLQNPQLDELSGLAASRRYPGLLYAHNDSGDSARVFLIKPNGETVAQIQLKGAYARDWEDMTLAGEHVYVGDIGDNLGWRDATQIYRFKEPALDPQKLNQSLEIAPETFAVRYPGGPRDAETLFAAPDGRLWILSKDKDGSSLFAARFEAGKTRTLARIGAKIRFGATNQRTTLATGGDFSPDGRKFVVTTYSQIHEWKLPAPFEVSNLANLKPTVRALPSLRQCESVCYSADGKQILVSSEGVSAPIYALTSAF